MSNDVAKQSVTALDNFAGFTDEVEGGDEFAAGKLIQGQRIKFVDPSWSNADTGAIITGTRLTLLDVLRVVTKWGPDNKPLETQILAPGVKWPNFDALNADCPRSEWREKFGKMQGPWSGQHAAYFIDADYNKFTWLSPLSTIGSAVAVTEVVVQVRLVRKFRGLVFAEVELGHKDWPTGPAGLKQRPCLLNDIRWIKLKNDQTTTLPAPDVTPSIASGAPADATPVEAPTRQEEMDDKIPW